MGPSFLSKAVTLLAVLPWAVFTRHVHSHQHSHSRGLEQHNTNSTADSSSLKTWWHNTGEINPTGHISNENVRQSHTYTIQVAAKSASEQFFDSFVYETIPRNGNGKICKPDELSSTCDTDDQITIEADIGVDMAWTQYLASEDTIVKISRRDGGSVDASNVVIRPTTLNFEVTSGNGTLLITVPFQQNGHRFSVEFQDNLWQYRNGNSGTASGYVQNKNKNGQSYVSEYTDDMPIVGVEPLNALLVFMSAFPEEQYVPDLENNTYTVAQGLVTDLTKVTESTLYFPPGVYWLTGSNHAILSHSINWVYLAPGAYVKGAIQYQSEDKDIRATGFGVLSGEQYVYQANTAQGYQNIKSDETSLKMWRGRASSGAKWTLHGLTINAPPFNSMDFYGDVGSFSVDASDYKQVGAFFGQTDGIEMYPGSHVRDVFYHVGDDGLKTYYSNVLVERMTVWKTNNAPIVQFGWYPRDLDNITIDNAQVIHTRYTTQQVLWPRGLVGSAVSYEDQESTSTADVTKHMSNYKLTNCRCEGVCPGLFGINPLMNIDSFLISNISVEQLAARTTEIGQSTMRIFTDFENGNQAVKLGENSTESIGLVIENFYVGDEKISFENDNWQMDQLGQINIDAYWEGHWTIR